MYLQVLVTKFTLLVRSKMVIAVLGHRQLNLLVDVVLDLVRLRRALSLVPARKREMSCHSMLPDTQFNVLKSHGPDPQACTLIVRQMICRLIRCPKDQGL